MLDQRPLATRCVRRKRQPGLRGLINGEGRAMWGDLVVRDDTHWPMPMLCHHGMTATPNLEPLQGEACVNGPAVCYCMPCHLCQAMQVPCGCHAMPCGCHAMRIPCLGIPCHVSMEHQAPFNVDSVQRHAPSTFVRIQPTLQAAPEVRAHQGHAFMRIMRCWAACIVHGTERNGQRCVPLPIKPSELR